MQLLAARFKVPLAYLSIGMAPALPVYEGGAAATVRHRAGAAATPLSAAYQHAAACADRSYRPVRPHPHPPAMS
jgi:hypothetical protein